MCTPWKASALKKAVQAACTVPTLPTHSLFGTVECGLSWGSAVQTLGHIRDDMSGPSVRHFLLGIVMQLPSHLGNRMGLTLVRRLRIFSIFKQFACSMSLVLKLEEVSCSCHLTSVFASYDVPT